MEPCRFFVGERIKVLDDILGVIQEGTIFYIELDAEIPGLYWLYLVSDIEEENTIIEPKFGNKPYWKIIPDSSEFIVTED